MGWWSVVKGIVRTIVRVVIAVVINLTVGLLDLFFGFLNWPPKKMRLHVFVLSEPNPGGDDAGGPASIPVASAADVQLAIDRTIEIYKKRANVKVVPYSSTFIEYIAAPPPASVLDFDCSFSSEYGEPGDYFANHLAGWNAIPISLTFPLTVFVVRSLKPLGCSYATIGDYVVIATPGLQDPTALAHEIGHCCNLWHVGDRDNLMINGAPGGDELRWWQRNILRSCRHVLYW